VAIERILRLSEHVVVVYYRYEVGSGNYGALFQLNERKQ